MPVVLESVGASADNARHLGAEAGRLNLAAGCNPFPLPSPEYDVWEEIRRRMVWETLMRNAPAPKTSMDEPGWFETRARDGEYHDPRDTLIAEEAALERVCE